MSKFLATCALLALSLSAAVAQTPGQITTYATINEAAIAAAQDMYAFSHYYESGGVLTKIGDRYAVGYLRTDWSGASVDLDYDPLHYTGVIVGDYHGHPCNTNNFIPSSFSAEDLRGDRTFHVEGFLLDMCTGEVHAFTPGRRQAELRLRDDRRAHHREDTCGRQGHGHKRAGAVLVPYAQAAAIRTH